MLCINRRSSVRLAAALLGAPLMLAATAAAQPGTPVYLESWDDCRTNDNRFRASDGSFRWDVDAGCDIYQTDVYERPMTQAFDLHKGRFGAKEYFEYLDITKARAGFDSKFLYVQIDLHGRNHRTSGGSVIPVGMVERYGFRMSVDPDGRFGVMIVADQPELKNQPKTSWGPIGTFGYLDTDGDVGGAADSGPTGLNVTKSDNPDEEDGMNGYDTPIIADGVLMGEQTVVWVRINPVDRTLVEFAIDYKAIGFTSQELESLGSLEFEAVKGGPKDPQNYRWNDKYTKVEAGSPNKGSGGKSEFGTNGCENIYELDTVRGGAITPFLGDFNGNGITDARDLEEFAAAHSAGLPSADVNQDGVVDVTDALEFVAALNRQ